MSPFEKLEVALNAYIRTTTLNNDYGTVPDDLQNVLKAFRHCQQQIEEHGPEALIEPE